MPELPEVQTVVDDLNKKITGKKITGVWFDWPKMFKQPKSRNFAAIIKGLEIKAVKRRGKNILIYLAKNYLLLIHQKMTGHLLIGKWNIRNKKIKPLTPASLKEKVNGYIHLIFKLNNGLMLGLSDLRKFAKVLFGPAEKIETLPDMANLGPDSLDGSLNVKKFKGLISREKRKIKQVLMDQEVIAGIGNIYSDDILWLAKIHPFRPAASLSKDELVRIYKAMRLILKKAVKLRGTSISDFRDTSGKAGGYGSIRLVYQLEGKPCKRCQILIKRVKMGGRSAHFCPKCQKL
ncbi:MAG: bifunctional DNA-formamidopyrimidine glycosylase/DNA-(apurinic or apyrimidinic site) lyase [Patescibacteria group bacterium]